MPLRPFSREQVYLLPPALDEWVPADHPLRFVAALVEGLPEEVWAAMGITQDGEVLGAPAYHPAALLAVWLGGFMSGIRSARALERACRDQISFRWLSGNQTPDHNTLWRFYRAHRVGMRHLLQQTVATALAAGLVDLALVAVDGTKVSGNAARDQTVDAERARQVLARVEAAIADLEAQNVAGAEADPLRLPAELARAEALHARVQQALATVEAGAASGGAPTTNLSDPDTRLLPTRQGWVAGYTAQTAVCRVAEGDADDDGSPGGRLILATTLTTAADDHGQLLPLVEAVVATCGAAPELVVADGGYHDGATVAACQARGQAVVMPEGQVASSDAPYHLVQFAYDPDHDRFTCPAGQVLTFRGTITRRARPAARLYRGRGAVCRACPAFGVCTTDAHQGRSLEVGPQTAALRQHRVWMATAPAQAVARQRKGLIEPVFGLLKEQHRLRRLLLRRLEHAQAEWVLGAVGFNLKTLARYWAAGRLPAPGQAVGGGPGAPRRTAVGAACAARWRSMLRSLPRRHHTLSFRF